MPVQLTAAAGALAGVRLGTGAIYLIAAVPLVIAAMIASVIWRSAKRDRVSRALRSRLESPNPKTRRDALDKVTDEVLATHSVMLAELLGRESDPDVLDALAAAVARSKWEPTDEASVLQLRRWVAGGQVRTTSSSGGARPSEASAETRASASEQPAPPLAAVDVVPEAAAVPPAPTPASTSPNGGEALTSKPAPATVPSSDLGDLVHRVREVLGEGVERVELVSIDGELLTSWSSAQRAPDEATPRDDS
jgi:hypothetical protein